VTDTSDFVPAQGKPRRITLILQVIVQDRVVALLRFIGRVSNLSLLTIESYSYYDHILDKMMGRKWRPGRDVVWVLVGVASCVPRPRGITGLHYFPVHVN
jgi:hypothetical protein